MPITPDAPLPPLTALEISTTRVVNAPRERVWELFRDAARLARWWGPKDFNNTFREFVFRVGGTWRFIMHAPNGTNYENHSTFLEIVRPGRIVLRHESAPHFKLTITLEDGAGGAKTNVTWHMLFPTPEERDTVATTAVDGIEQNLDRLEEELGA